MSSAPEALFATAAHGLEEVLAREVRGLGGKPEPEWGGVTWKGPPGTHQEANLRLRTANGVLLELGRTQTEAGAAWVRSLRKVWLERCGDPRGAGLKVFGAGQAGSTVERAARAVLGLGVVNEGAQLTLHLRVDGRAGSAALYADTSGGELFRRGYRQEIARAPMRETLAAGLLALAGYDGETPFWDGLCGSGSLAIEAALLARGKAPGAGRSFAFQHWPGFDAAAWAAKEARARSEERPRASQPIWAGDLNAGSLGTTRRNARRAGVLEDLTLQRQNCSAFIPPAGTPAGVWISNLPYGKRTGTRAELAGLYAALAETRRRAVPNWRTAFLVMDGKPLEQAMGGPPARRFPVVNGGLDCELLVWE